MALRRGKCTNFGNCMDADSGRTVEVPEGKGFVCPKCTRPLHPLEERQTASSMPMVAFLLVLLLIGGGAAWRLFRQRSGTSDATKANAASLPSGVHVILRLHGSNTIGAQLGPALAQAYLRQQGGDDIKVVPGKADEVTVEGSVSGSRQAIAIAAHGSATAFADLATGKCDIGMASRKIKAEEVTSLSSLGDMSSPASEHVLGLDGVAVIVNRANPVTSLSIEQAAKLFSGEITDWSAVSGTSGSVKVYSRDDRSGTYDTFRTLVLDRRKLIPAAARIEDSRELSEKVADDANAIGFVGFPYVDGAKAVAVSDKGTRAMLPTRLTIATEDYPLSRRLYLYNASNATREVRRFIDFALSKQGQDIVAANGFVAQNVNTETVSAPAGSPPGYTRLTSGAERLSLNFRFRTGSSQLDNKALVDLNRVVSFISDLHYTGSDILLFGFADSTGSEAVNEKLAMDRARTVSNQFEERGVKAGVVSGFGSHNPVAANDTDEGRQRNRRVEIWIRQKHGV